VTVGLMPAPPMKRVDRVPTLENGNVPKSSVVGATVMHGVAAA
jgi:hypothetical protein